MLYQKQHSEFLALDKSGFGGNRNRIGNQSDSRSATHLLPNPCRNQGRWLDPGEYPLKVADLYRFPLEGHALGHIARNRLPTPEKFLLGWQLPPSLDVFDPSHRS